MGMAENSSPRRPASNANAGDRPQPLAGSRIFREALPGGRGKSRNRLWRRLLNNSFGVYAGLGGNAGPGGETTQPV